VKEPCLTAKMLCIVFVFCSAAAIASPAQVFTTLHSFSGTDGNGPTALVQASDGDFYGTTAGGGTNNNCYGSGCGTVFKITPQGTLTTLHSFDGTDGSGPLYGGLMQAADGSLYGTTSAGGTFNNCNSYPYPPGCGTVFKITPDGTFTTLHNFDGTDGGTPIGRLVQAADGNLYGTTASGGTYSYCNAYPCGTVFKITPNGTLTTMHTFDLSDGESPYAGLIQATDGNLYGTTTGGGANGSGTVFEISPVYPYTLVTLHSFYGTDGRVPEAPLIQATDGNFYGVTYLGGANDWGTAFRITSNGTLTTLHRFFGPDGKDPVAGLVQASDGDFYGTADIGGGEHWSSGGGCGTVFRITPGGTLDVLHSFGGGCNPIGGLVQATDGNFYGTTATGGGEGFGTVFRLMTKRACVSCPSVE